jgi:glycogen operon protein
MLTTLLTSHGTPMLLAGDEFGRTQQGNNNAYCQDSEISWFDWTLAESAEGRALTEFTARLIALRKANSPLRANYFMNGLAKRGDGLNDISWFDEKGTPMTDEAWQFSEGRLLVCRRICPAASGDLECTLLLLNAASEPHAFTLPTPAIAWSLVVDSAHPDRTEAALDEPTLTVDAHGAVLLLASHRPAA